MTLKKRTAPVTRENSAAKRAARDLAARTGMPYAAALRQVMAEHGDPGAASDDRWAEQPDDPRLLVALMGAAQAFEQGRDEDADAAFDVWMQLPDTDRSADLDTADRFGRIGQFGHMAEGNLRPVAGRLAARWLEAQRATDRSQIADAIDILVESAADFIALIDSTDPLPGRERGDDTGLQAVRLFADEKVDWLLNALDIVGDSLDPAYSAAVARHYLDIADAIDDSDFGDPRLDIAWMAPSIQAEVATQQGTGDNNTGEATLALLKASERPVEEVAFMSAEKVQRILAAAKDQSATEIELVKDQGAYLMVGSQPDTIVEYFDNHPDPDTLDKGDNPMDLNSEWNRARERTQLAFGGDDFFEAFPTEAIAKSLGKRGLNVHLELVETPAAAIRRAYPIMVEREAIFGPTTIRELEVIGLSPED